jgi:hypothetical protein
MIVRKVISGAQTGADRGALDAALDLGVSIGGWVPKGRKAEDGAVPDHYPNLQETETGHYESRTRRNVRDSDATLILSHGALHGGSRFARDMAEELRRPCLHVDLDEFSIDDAVAAIRDWLARIDGETLNVAGTRESSDPKIYQATKEIMKTILAGGQDTH